MSSAVFSTSDSHNPWLILVPCFYLLMILFQCFFPDRSDPVPLMLASWFVRDGQFNKSILDEREEDIFPKFRPVSSSHIGH